MDCIYAHVTLSDHLFFRTGAFKAAEWPSWLADNSTKIKQSQIGFVILIAS
jgi:hypothetical protein